MSRTCRSLSPIIAYASITNSNMDQDHDLNLLRRWCERVPMEIEILAEEIHPSEHARPLWSEILKEIESGIVKTLIVPSLFHIAGDDFVAFSKFLNFLKIHGTTLKSLTELIDSRRDSRNEIILRLHDDINGKTECRGAI